MSLFGSIKSFAQNLVGPKVSEKIYTAANTALTVLTKPIQSVTGRFEKAYETTAKQGAVSLASQGAVNAALVTAPFSSAIRGAAYATVSQLSPLTKIGLTGAAIVGIPFLASHPSLIPEPSGLAGAGADIPKEPSLESGISYIKQHPYMSATALAAGLAVLGFGSYSVATLISNYSNTKAVKENTEATRNGQVFENNNTPELNNYKDQIKIIEAQTKAQETILEAQTKQTKEIYDYTTMPVAKSNFPESTILPTVAEPVLKTELAAPVGKKAKKKKKTIKKKAKKKQKTRRSKRKRKTKSIKRRKK